MTKQLKSNGSQVVNLINLYLVYKTNKLLGQDRSKMRNGEWELAYVCFAKTESEARFTTVYTGDWAGPLTIELLGTTVDRKPGVQVVYHRIPTSQEVRENFIDPWGVRIGAGSAWNVQLIQAVATPEEIVSGHDFIIVSEGK